ncbi:MAG TPA: DUF3536 domain-containing protein [Chloroflexia bacterium]|nr:DUF3536 domain-containing protein [Chloroflexia bacterium]
MNVSKTPTEVSGPSYFEEVNSPAQVCIHAHFYQPPRDNPFTGAIPDEPGAEPFHNFNEKINAECYRPNALAGNFETISFNVGPTLATWIEKNDPETYRRIIEADRTNYARFGFGNAMAQNYNHVILPLCSPEDARLQIEWGIKDFMRRFGHAPEGMWLAETGASTWVLDLLAQAGIKFVILAPWQADFATVETINPREWSLLQSKLRQEMIDRWRAEAQVKLNHQNLTLEEREKRVKEISYTVPSLPNRVPEPFDVTEPYLVELNEGRSIIVFFYNGKLSGDVSFNQQATANANRFAHDWLQPELNAEKQCRSEAQLLMIATDGELYGHHQSYRDLFLQHLTRVSVATAGMQLTFPSLYMRQHPPTRRIRIHDRSSWSCHHGIERWSNGCYCTPGDSSWKKVLRQACDLLRDEVDRVYYQHGKRLFKDPTAAARDFLYVWQGVEPEGEFLARHLKQGITAKPATQRMAMRLLQAQGYKHQMYTSCAWFFEDIDRIEPKNALAAASIIFRLLNRLLRPHLQTDFETILALARSQNTGLNGAQLYRRGLRLALKSGVFGRPPTPLPTTIVGSAESNDGQEAVA